MTDSTSGLQVVGLTAGYGKAVVVRDLSLRIEIGEIVGLCGRNGAGKTTTLRAISGSIPRSARELSIDGAPLPSSTAGCARAGVSHVPEGRRLFASLTVEENIRFGAELGRSAGREEQSVEALCSIFPRLRGLLERHAGTLSGGEQQIVAIARGMASSPTILLVDEVTLGLAPIAAEEILRELRVVVTAGKMGVLLVDQNARLLAESCDRILVMNNAKAKEIPPEELANENWFTSNYFGD